MAKENEVVVFENIGGVDEDIHRLSENPITNLLDVEIVHLYCDNDLVENDELHLLAIVVQVHKWKVDNRNSICLGIFVINDNFPIDLKNPHEVASSIDQLHKKLATF
jgi:hypothetical protein